MVKLSDVADVEDTASRTGVWLIQSQQSSGLKGPRSLN